MVKCVFHPNAGFCVAGDSEEASELSNAEETDVEEPRNADNPQLPSDPVATGM